ncbi:N-acetylmuramoyl-L-alanine amidase [Kitasatospora sp. NPDC088160]|uniref:peptidoglycan recognition protein family protein n=1 Tax=Kitasatospora sp. NPDC088160 TaxID=3364072 RepID=UPI00380003E0
MERTGKYQPPSARRRGLPIAWRHRLSANIISRGSWGAKPWNGTPNNVAQSERTEFYVHYDGGDPVGRTGNAVPQAIEREHLGNGWAGIGYNFVVDQDGAIYEGRGWNLQGAHCPGHNRSAFGVQIAIGGDQAPSAAALNAARALYDETCARAGRSLAKRGHKDGFATLCPGPKLYSWVQAGMPAPGGGGNGGGGGALVALAAGVKPGVRHPQVRELQELLLKAGYGPIPGAVTDYYGPATQNAVARFHDRHQDLKSRGVSKDYAIGARGWALLQKEAGR